MRTALRYLWKEWRDHRVVVLGTAIAVPLLLLLARILVPERFLDDPIFSQAGAWGALAITTLAFASDLVPGEARRGRMVFLARMPAGLPAAFRAKIIFLLGVLAAAPLYGFVAGACFGGWHSVGLQHAGGYVLLLACAAPWIFAVSCWLPRGALALPATALALALFALPFYLIHLWYPEYRPIDADVVGWALALAAGAFFVAWISFTRGFRYGGTFLSAGWRGLLASALLLMPAYAYGGYRVHEWTTVDPASAEFRVLRVQVGEGDRFLFVNAAMDLRGGKQRAHHGLLVDTRDGSWRRVGAGFDYFEHSTYQDLATARVVPLAHPESVAKDERNPEWTKMWFDWYDARTGERFKSGWSNRLPKEVDALAYADRPVWERGFGRVFRIGLGWVVRKDGAWKFSDPFREKIYPLPKRKSRRPQRYPLVLPQGWLVFRGEDEFLLDPDTGDERPCANPGAVELVLSDGRLLVEEEDETFLFDPATGNKASVEGAGPHLRRVGLDGHFVTWTQQGQTIVRFDEVGRRFVPVLVCDQPVALDGDRVIVLEDQRRIIRVDRASGERKVLFGR